MQIVVKANDKQWEELIAGSNAQLYIRLKGNGLFSDYLHVAAYINLDENAAHEPYDQLSKPVFLNSVTDTLKEKQFPANVFRINGWASFIERPVWEIAGNINADAKAIIDSMGKKLTHVKDEPGFIAARIISMIINEAYFALGENVSSKAEIDIAMKLGTNYPYGPFEWAEKITVGNVLRLLERLAIQDIRCNPAPLLIREAAEKK